MLEEVAEASDESCDDEEIQQRMRLLRNDVPEIGAVSDGSDSDVDLSDSYCTGCT